MLNEERFISHRGELKEKEYILPNNSVVLLKNQKEFCIILNGYKKNNLIYYEAILFNDNRINKITFNCSDILKILKIGTNLEKDSDNFLKK